MEARRLYFNPVLAFANSEGAKAFTSLLTPQVASFRLMSNRELGETKQAT
jgi:hypothetical protein